MAEQRLINALMSQSIQATPAQYPMLAKFAEALRQGNSFAGKPFGYDNPPVQALTNFLGVPAVANTMDNIAYGMPLTKGRGRTLQMTPDTTEALTAVAPFAPAVGKSVAKGTEAAARYLAPKAGEMAENYALQSGLFLPMACKGKKQTITVNAADELFNSLGIPKSKVMADVDKLQRKHPDDFKTADDVENHLNYIFGAKPNVILNAADPRFTIIAGDSKGMPVITEEEFRSATTDFTGARNGNYWVRSAFPMSKDQVTTKLRKEAEGLVPEPIVKIRKPQEK